MDWMERIVYCSELDVPEIPDCMMPVLCWDPGPTKWLFRREGKR